MENPERPVVSAHKFFLTSYLSLITIFFSALPAAPTLSALQLTFNLPQNPKYSAPYFKPFTLFLILTTIKKRIWQNF